MNLIDDIETRQLTMSTAAGEQKASRYYPAEEEAIMKKVCADSNS